MGSKYYLMRKNEIITMLHLDDVGNIDSFSNKMSERGRDISPLSYTNQPDKFISEWWKERAIPLTREYAKKILELKGCTPPEYLVRNLGLSLTDYYWINPVEHMLDWDDINLFQNDFKDNLLFPTTEENKELQYSPNSSLQGDKEKTWAIIDNKRYLIKGNRSTLSKESFNETIANKIYESQNYKNYTQYNLLHIKERPYKYGCMSELFTSLDKEFISAWDICSSEKRKNDISMYEHFINVCALHGIDKEQLRYDLEMQIMVDFILSGYDRHLNNLGIIRDAETLQFLRLAPIYDSGDCLFANKEIPSNMKELQKMEINSFTKTELGLLKYVTDTKIIDLTKLPGPSFIRLLYEKDENIAPYFASKICNLYEKKIEMCRAIQLNRDPYKISFSAPDIENTR